MKKHNFAHAMIGAAASAAFSAYGLANQDFGPGNSSEFAISPTESAYVVGVYGLDASDFAKRADGFRAFSDGRLVDIEKHSGAYADDHRSCSEYSDLNIFFWGGWTDELGYKTEDALAAAYHDEALYDAPDAEWESIDFDGSFAQNLEKGMACADALMWMPVVFDNYNWYGEFYDQIFHAVVCCGYSLDTTKAFSDPSRLKALFIIDPDNDREKNGGGSAAPDTITYCPVKWNASSQRYEIKGVFGTTGYLDNSDCGDLLRAKSTPVRRKFVASNSSGQSQQTANTSEIKRIYSKLRTFKTSYLKYQEGCDLEDEDRCTDGIATIKISKANSRGQVKFMVRMTPFFGSSASATKVVSPDENGDIDTTIAIPGFGTFNFMAGEDSGDFYFEAYNNEYETWNGDFGGTFDTDSLYFKSNANDIPSFSDRDVIKELLPLNYGFSAWGGSQWTFKYRPSLGFAKAATGSNILATYSSGWSLVAGTTLLGDNYSGLSLKYKPDSGIFQGSYRIFYTNAEYTSGKPKAKAVKVTVRGVVFHGEYGIGQAAVKIQGRIYKWPILIDTAENYEDDWEDCDDCNDDDWGF